MIVEADYKQNLEMMQPGKLQTSQEVMTSLMFLPKGGAMFRSTPIRKLLFMPKRHVLYVAGWNTQCSDSRELDRGALAIREMNTASVIIMTS